MPNVAADSVTNRKEFEVSLAGLEMFYKDLARTGVSRGLLEAATTHLIRTYRPVKHTKSVTSKAAKGGTKEHQKEATPKPMAQESPKELAKLSGLNKVQSVSYTSFKAYTAEANKAAREAVEKTWGELIAKKEAEGKTRADAIHEFFELKGLSPDEVKASRAYFPKFYVPAKSGNGSGAAQ
jgi:hypothetical protein